MKRVVAILIISYLCISNHAFAGINKCKGPDGSITFQSEPCANNETPENLSNPMIKINNSASNKITNLYSTAPEVANLKPTCKTGGSTCGCSGISYYMDARDPSILIRAMKILPEYWNEYNKLLKRSSNEDKINSSSSLNSVGCKILLTQLLIDKQFENKSSVLTWKRDQYDQDSIKIRGTVSDNNPYQRTLDDLNDAAKKVGLNVQ